MKRFFSGAVLAAGLLLTGCEYVPDADQVDSQQQEKTQAEATRQAGLPNITNFRTKKTLKQIMEKVDQADLLTYTYTVAEQTGQLVWFCDSVGFPIPTATQYTNPEKLEHHYGEVLTLPQADPDGTFKPTSADASWVICIDNKGKQQVTYVEPKIVTFQYRR